MITISHKIDCKTKNAILDKGHYRIKKEESIKKDIAIVKIYAPNTGATRYIKQLITIIKKLGYNNTIVVGRFNTTLT